MEKYKIGEQVKMVNDDLMSGLKKGDLTTVIGTTDSGIYVKSPRATIFMGRGDQTKVDPYTYLYLYEVEKIDKMEIKIGDKVFSDKYGIGEVTDIPSSTGKDEIVVQFEARVGRCNYNKFTGNRTPSCGTDTIKVVEKTKDEEKKEMGKYKFEVGQEVLVRSDLKAGRRYGASNVTCGQSSMAGRVATIAKRVNDKYFLTDCSALFFESMLSAYAKTSAKDFKGTTKLQIVVGHSYQILPDLKRGYDHCYFVNSLMEKLAGKVATVTKANGNTISIDLDNGEWSWNDTMFSKEIGKETLATPEIEYAIGDRVLVRSDLKGGITTENHVYITSDMAEKAGKIITLKSKNEYGFKIKEDIFTWPVSAFAGKIGTDSHITATPDISTPISMYKIGDKVRVKRDLHKGQYGSDTVVSDMTEMAGKVVTISSIVSETQGTYKINEHCWNWTNEMFEGLAKEEPTYSVVTIKFDHAGANTYNIDKKVSMKIGDKVFVSGAMSGKVGTCVGKPSIVTESDLQKMIHGMSNLQNVLGMAEPTITYTLKPF